MKVILPAKPIDQYRLDWWQISVSDTWYFISKQHAIYHIHTPWNEYSPNEKGGEDLIDDWMIHKNNHAEGRWCGWDSPSKSAWGNCFLTKEEATAEIRNRLSKYLQQSQDKAKHIKTMIGELDTL